MLSFFPHKICFYSDQGFNRSSSGISLLPMNSMIETFWKADLIILPELRNLLYRLISHCACICFIFDNLVSISIWWTFFPLLRPFVTSFAYQSWKPDFRDDFATPLTLRSRDWKLWVKIGSTVHMQYCSCQSAHDACLLFVL